MSYLSTRHIQCDSRVKSVWRSEQDQAFLVFSNSSVYVGKTRRCFQSLGSHNVATKYGRLMGPFTVQREERSGGRKRRGAVEERGEE